MDREFRSKPMCEELPKRYLGRIINIQNNYIYNNYTACIINPDEIREALIFLAEVIRIFIFGNCIRYKFIHSTEKHFFIPIEYSSSDTRTLDLPFIYMKQLKR